MAFHFWSSRTLSLWAFASGAQFALRGLQTVEGENKGRGAWASVTGNDLCLLYANWPEGAFRNLQFKLFDLTTAHLHFAAPTPRHFSCFFFFFSLSVSSGKKDILGDPSSNKYTRNEGRKNGRLKINQNMTNNNNTNNNNNSNSKRDQQPWLLCKLLEISISRGSNRRL